MSQSKSKEYNEVKNSILKQLEGRGVTDKVYMSMVDSYMNSWENVKNLEEDIKIRGVAVKAISGNTGIVNMRKNESIGERQKELSLMIRMLDALKIEPNENIVGDSHVL